MVRKQLHAHRMKAAAVPATAYASKHNSSNAIRTVHIATLLGCVLVLACCLYRVCNHMRSNALPFCVVYLN